MRYVIIMVLLFMPWTVALGQDVRVEVQLQDGNSIAAASRYFLYDCLTFLDSKSGLGTRASWRSQDLRLVVDEKERLIPARLVGSINFVRTTPELGAD